MTNQEVLFKTEGKKGLWELTEQEYEELMACPVHMTLSQYEDYKASKQEVEEMEDEDIF